jgi:hypothetical protein
MNIIDKNHMILFLMKILMKYNLIKNVNELMLQMNLMMIFHRIFEDQEN